ncbi:MAG TPA: PAS domain S-box protein, partial [Solirubrobacteraceae bacterium]|nr:PAS domain S-box protein [Solirubrobacteraceae bacterium]
RRAEHEVDDIFDLSQDLLGIVGVDGYLKRVNPAFESTLEYTATELLERPLLEFVHPDDRDATRTSIDGLRTGHDPGPFESRYVRADGAVRWLQWNMRPMPERGLMYAAVHDVTDTRMLVQEQAALRRVATLVAEGHGADDLLQAVAVEVGQLLGADATRLLRYEQDGTALVVAAHGASDAEIGLGDLDPEQSNVWKHIAENVRSTGRSGALAESLLAPGIAAAFASPIIVSGRPWGVIVAKWTHADEARPDTESRMRQFTELVAIAVANADSRSELTASRRRVVAAADETRQRIERDLHDGAQQRLVQTMLTLKLAQRELGEDSHDAAELVERALQSTESANDELRELARGIHPAVLTRGGLAPALKNVARRSPIPVVLDLRTDRELPEQTQVTAYFVISEALTNAAKHSSAATVRVTVEAKDGDVLLSISDDGVGGADPTRGSGLVGLKDRVEAAGGTLSVHSPPGGGTHLTIRLPPG